VPKQFLFLKELRQEFAFLRKSQYTHPMFEIVTVASGAKSLRCLKRMETFHPKIGPMQEAQKLHVDQQNLSARAKLFSPFVLWDVGLGAAANAIAAIETLKKIPSEIHSFDLSLEPIKFALENKKEFPYIESQEAALRELLTNGQTRIENLDWYFHLGDFRTTMWEVSQKPHGVFYDPYSPKTNGEVWTLDHFERFHSLLPENCLLTNYSRSTAVRVTLLLAGFFVGIGRDIGEKAETTIFSTTLDLLENPLQKSWLNRVLISGNSAPARSENYELLPISKDDFERVKNHPQFS
jgi:hypothetical protein